MWRARSRYWLKKLRAAAQAGAANCKEWLLDLKQIALDVKDVQVQVTGLLQAIHSFVNNTQQQPPAAVPTPAATGGSADAGRRFGGGGGDRRGGLLGGFSTAASAGRWRSAPASGSART